VCVGGMIHGGQVGVRDRFSACGWREQRQGAMTHVPSAAQVCPPAMGENRGAEGWGGGEEGHNAAWDRHACP
jgi:hypothetical protein